jgi:hypothetical protein
VTGRDTAHQRRVKVLPDTIGVWGKSNVVAQVVAVQRTLGFVGLCWTLEFKKILANVTFDPIGSGAQYSMISDDFQSLLEKIYLGKQKKVEDSKNSETQSLKAGVKVSQT